MVWEATMWVGRYEDKGPDHGEGNEARTYKQEQGLKVLR